MKHPGTLSKKFFSFIQEAPPLRVGLIVVLGAVILRLPAVIIDFIHIDVITTYLLAKRDLAGLSFIQNKGGPYHFLMKWGIAHIADTPSVFHFFGLLFILATMAGIFLMAKKIYDTRTGLYASLLYGFLISCFNTEYLAANGEIFYNLFFVLAFYCYYMSLFEKKHFLALGVPIMLAIALSIKFQGIFAVIVLTAHLTVIHPWFTLEGRKRRTYFISAFVAGCLALIGAMIDWNFSGILFTPELKSYLMGHVAYVANRGFNPAMIFGKLAWRAYQFSLFHAALWVPAILFTWNFFRKKNGSAKDLFLITAAGLLFLSVFSGGGRMSVHYFIPALPWMAILSARYTLSFLTDKGRARAFTSLAFAVIFFFTWNYRDLYIYTCNHDLKHNESAFTFFFRIIVIGSYGEYLLPHKSLKPAIDYINAAARPGDTTLTWPMGNELDYYTGGRSVTHNYWFNEGALYAIVQREKGNPDFITLEEKSMISLINETRPTFFIDLSPTEMIRKILIYRKKDDPLFHFDPDTVPMVRFGRFGSMDDFPKLVKYLNDTYEFRGTFGGARIWERRK